MSRLLQRQMTDSVTLCDDFYVFFPQDYGVFSVGITTHSSTHPPLPVYITLSHYHSLDSTPVIKEIKLQTFHILIFSVIRRNRQRRVLFHQSTRLTLNNDLININYSRLQLMILSTARSVKPPSHC